MKSSVNRKIDRVAALRADCGVSERSAMCDIARTAQGMDYIAYLEDMISQLRSMASVAGFDELTRRLDRAHDEAVALSGRQNPMS